MNSHLGLFLLSCIRLCVTQMYVLDDRFGLGRRFDGIGGLSGGGVGYLRTTLPGFGFTFCFLPDLTSEAVRIQIFLYNIVFLGYFETTNQLCRALSESNTGLFV